VSLLVATACGGSGRPATRSTTSPATTRRPARNTAFLRPASALVSMRQYSPQSLIWQTVWVNATGAGVVTTLVGETVGATQKRFQLSVAQAAHLRQLVAAARAAQPPAAGGSPTGPGYIYTLHIAGRPTLNIQGATAEPLSALVDFLNGLMLTYCC